MKKVKQVAIFFSKRGERVHFDDQMNKKVDFLSKNGCEILTIDIKPLFFGRLMGVVTYYYNLENN